MELLIGIVIVGIVLFFVFGFGAKAGVNLAKDTLATSPRATYGRPKLTTATTS